ncbi:MAG: hypothetical protein V1865_01180 [bacterium]
MKNLKKIVLSLTVIALVFTSFQIPLGQTKTKAYYSGDAINYNNQIVVASTDSGYLELFRLEGKELNRIARFKPLNSKFGTEDEFYTVMLKQEMGRLYAYASSGHELYKYNVTDPKNIILADKLKDNSMDWFGGLEVSNGYLITKGSKNLKLWNKDMQVVDAFNVVNQTNPYNITLGDDYKYIFNIANDNVEIFDRQSRSVIKQIAMTSNNNKGNIKIYNDSSEGMFYVPDGKQLKKYNYLGYLHKSMDHESNFGYDVVPATDGKHIYFSNGSSIKKLDKIDLNLVSEYKNRTDLGYWSMGMKAVNDGQGEKVVVFNNNSITIFDSNLNIITYVKATEKDTKPIVTEGLFLSLSQKSAVPLEDLTVYGGGFASNEPIQITLNKQRVIGYADQNGRFAKQFTISPMEAGRTDIKAVGQNSGQHYSISFEVKELK